jgi:hypothetical protein
MWCWCCCCCQTRASHHDWSIPSVHPKTPQSNLTRLFVNDIEVFVPPNTTVLEACEKVGVQVRP